MDYEIDFEKRDHRIANIFGIVTGIIGYLLYVFEYVQYDSLYDEEYFFPVLYGGLCYFLGLVSGLICFASKNIIGIFLPFASLLIQIIFFGDVGGDGFKDFLGVSGLLILSIFIVLAISFLVGLAIQYVNNGKWMDKIFL